MQRENRLNNLQLAISIELLNELSYILNNLNAGHLGHLEVQDHQANWANLFRVPLLLRIILLLNEIDCTFERIFTVIKFLLLLGDL